MDVVQVVRKLGRVGGMESYVWFLSRELASLGVTVHVICESVVEMPDLRILVHCVERSSNARRYKALQEFSCRVSSYVQQNPDRFKSALIHSHERTDCHQITTFHGPPIKGMTTWFRLKTFFSPRLRAWHQMEEKELLSSQVQSVVPVSGLLRDELEICYPGLTSKIPFIGYPGFDMDASRQLISLPNREEVVPYKCVFVGKEWSRKGLDIAIKIGETARARLIPMELDVYGVDEHSIASLVRGRNWVKIKGWQDVVPWQHYNVLLHPARKEPFGMVVSEALSAGLLVLCSDKVGAVEYFPQTKNISAVRLGSKIDVWVDALGSLISLTERDSISVCGWTEVAEQYLSEYKRIMHMDAASSISHTTQSGRP